MDEPKWKANKRKTTAEYNRKNYKRIPLDVQKSYYDEVLKVVCDKVGESMSAFIKKAIAQRIEREGLIPESYNKVDEKLFPIIDDALDYILSVITVFTDSGHPERVESWENTLGSKIRYYIRDKYDLTKHERDQIAEEVEKRYWDSK